MSTLTLEQIDFAEDRRHSGPDMRLEPIQARPSKRRFDRSDVLFHGIYDDDADRWLADVEPGRSSWN